MILMIIYKAVCWSKEFNSYISLWVHNNFFQLKYNIGEITEAPKAPKLNTLGIFCFNSLDVTRKYIIDFFTAHIGRKYVQILEVEGIGDCVIPEYISKSFTLGSLWSYYYNYSDNRGVIKVPEETVCYPSVKVIRKVRNFLKND